MFPISGFQDEATSELSVVDDALMDEVLSSSECDMTDFEYFSPSDVESDSNSESSLASDLFTFYLTFNVPVAKVERQLGGPIENPQILSRLLLLTYRKVCSLSTSVRGLSQKESRCTTCALGDNTLPSIYMKSEADYHNFVDLLNNADFRNRVVSS